MITSLSNSKFWQNGVFFLIIFFFLYIFLCLGINISPALIDDGTASGFELHAVRYAKYCCLGIIAVRVEHSDKATANQILDFALIIVDIGKIARFTSRYNGMVICHLAVVEYSLGLWKGIAMREWLHILGIVP